MSNFSASEAKPVSDASRTPRSVLPSDDGVYRPQFDTAPIAPVAANEDEAARDTNGPPEDFNTLEDVFPGLANNPGFAIPMAPIDGFLGVSGLADEANLEATMGQYWRLTADIKEIDPSFSDSELLPPGGFEGLDLQGRANLIDSLRMERAAAYYNMRGNADPLQVETLR